jgi:hypothetical protein
LASRNWPVIGSNRNFSLFDICALALARLQV